MKHLKSQKGNTFVTAIMVLVIGSIVALTLLSFSMNATTRNEHRENYTQATKYAEDGVNHLIGKLEKELVKILPDPVIGSSVENPELVYAEFYQKYKAMLNDHRCGGSKELIHPKAGETTYHTCIKNYDYNSGRDTYSVVTIQSTGYAEGEEKTLEVEVEFGTKYKDYPSFLDFAVSTHNGELESELTDYEGGTLVLNGGVHIKGNVLADGNIVVSDYGYAPVVSKASEENSFAKINRNPWKQSTLPQITSTNLKPAQVYINQDKNLYFMKSYKFDKSNNACKRSPEVIGLLNGVVNSLLGILGPLIPTVDTLGDYYTYYDLVNHDFNDSLTDCIFDTKSTTEFEDYLINSKTELNNFTQPIEVLDVNEFIGQGKNSLSSLNKSLNKNILFNETWKKNSKVDGKSLILVNSTLKGDYYLENSPNDSINTSLTADLNEDLAALPEVGSILDSVLGTIGGLLGGILGKIPLIGDITDALGLTKNITTTSGQFYINPDETFLNFEHQKTNQSLLIDTLIGLLSNENKALHIAPGILASGKHTLEGVYYIDGDVKIIDTTLVSNAILFVNGNVSIKHTTINTKDNHPLIIFATGNIVYDYSSEAGSHIGADYYNQNKQVIHAFLYSNQKVELHGTLSNIHIKGGISANKVVLTGVRGDVKSKTFTNFEFSDPSDSSKASRLIIEHDPKIKETFKDFVDSNTYGTLKHYHELFIEPTRMISRKTI